MLGMAALLSLHENLASLDLISEWTLRKFAAYNYSMYFEKKKYQLNLLKRQKGQLAFL